MILRATLSLIACTTVACKAPVVAQVAPASVSPTSQAIHLALCAQAAACFVASTQPAGTDATGRDLTVVEVVHGAKPDNVDKQPWRDASFGEECVRYGYTLLISEGATIVEQRDLLDLCNDGYGARGMGQDTITVAPNRFDHQQVGGSSWMWSTSTSNTLWPDKLMADGADSFFVLGPNTSTWTWNHETFTGKAEWANTPCGGDKGDDDLIEHSYTLIPAITLDPKEAWSDTPLGRCAAAVDASGAGGFVTWGKPGDAGDASVRTAVINSTTLVIDVRDDEWTSGAKTWLFDDHVELWLSPQSGTSLHMDKCLHASYPAAQWAIRVSDGQVFKGAGAGPNAPEVTRAALQDGAVRLTVKIPNPNEGITVVYSDSDDGTTQERLIATSPIVLTDATTIGGAHSLHPGACVVRDGRIEPAAAATIAPR